MRLPQRTAQTRSDGARIWISPCTLGRVYNPKIKSKEVRWKCLCRNCGRIVQVSSYWLRISDPYGHCKCTRFHKPNQDELRLTFLLVGQPL